jgi:hypothetical protein
MLLMVRSQDLYVLLLYLVHLDLAISFYSPTNAVSGMTALRLPSIAPIFLIFCEDVMSGQTRERQRLASVVFEQ